MNKRSIRFIRPGSSGGHELFSLFKTCFGHELDETWWRWKYNPPSGKGENLIALVDGEVAGHYGAYPVKLLKGRTQYTVHHIGDVMIAPKFRGLGVGRGSLIHRLTQAFYRECCGGIAFNYGCPSERHARLGKALLDYELLDPITVWQLELEGFNPSPYTKLLKKFFLNRLKLQPVSVGIQVERLFECVSNYFPMVIKKNLSYLRWRYQEHPTAQYKYLGLLIGGKLRIWTVSRLQNSTLELGELILKKRDWYLLPLFITGLQSHFPEAKRLTLWSNPHLKWPSMVLKKMGFTSHPHPLKIFFTIKRFDRKTLDKETIRKGMYYSLGDFDLF